MRFRTAVALLSIVFASPVLAQSSLGITGASLSLSSVEDELGVMRTGISSSVDVRVVQVHGLEGHLSFSDTSTGAIGHLAGHIYMAPRPGQKYGLFATLSDVDGRSMAWGSLGAAGMLELGEATLVEGRLGLGAADGNSLDYIFGGISLAHAFSPAFEVEIALDLADFDEAAFRATSIETSLTARYSPEGSSWGVFASVTQSDLTGRDGGSGATRFGLGLSFDFGTSGGTGADTRHFRQHDPVAPLIRLGLW